MAKAGEIEYLRNLGNQGQRHAYDKPFSDDKCGRYLIDLGAIMSVLPKPPARLLDLGVGTGWTSALFALRGYEVTGQDIAADMISLAQKNSERYRAQNVRFVVSDYESLKYQNEFDAAVFYDSLHHAVDERLALQSAFRALKPGGVCVTVEPGVGHSKSADSVRAKTEWNVTEKDMPPRHIIQIGREIGFRNSRICLRYDEPFETLSSPSLSGLLRSAKTFLRFLPCVSALKTNIVVLKK